MQQTTLQSKPAQEDVHRGAFLALKSVNLIEPDDITAYDEVSYNALKAQGLVMSFSVLWTRLYEMGNFKIPVKSRYVYYAIGVSIPSFIHAFFVASKVNDSIKHFDKKYTPKYYEQYIEAISKKQTN